MDSLEEQQRRQEEIKQKSRAWKERLGKAVDDILKAPGVDRKALFDVLWTHGVLGRIAPEDHGERSALKERRKPLWEGGRDNPELYWRILYSAAAAEYAARHHFTYTVLEPSLIAGALEGAKIVFLLNTDKAKEIFPESFQLKAPIDTFALVAIDCEERAREELKARGVDPTGHPIPIGAHGIWEGMGLTVKGYTQSGLIEFQADSYEEHNRLFDFVEKGAISGVSPSRINAKDFVLARSKK